MSFFTVSVRYGGSEISASNFSEMLPYKAAMVRAAAAGKHESSSIASLGTKSRKVCVYKRVQWKLGVTRDRNKFNFNRGGAYLSL